MDYQTLLFTQDQKGIAIITLNRPQSLNSFEKMLCLELEQCLAEVSDRKNIKVAIITGTGKAFSAGGDIKWLMESDTVEKKEAILQSAQRLITKLYYMEKPVIAAVNGAAAGAGISLVLASDIAIAAENARFAPNFIKMTLVPDSASSYLLPKTLGIRKALQLFWSGEALSAKEAHELGIFDLVVPAEKLMEEAYALAEKLALGPYLAIKRIKSLIKASVNNDLFSQVALENYYQMLSWSDSEFQNAVAGFFNRGKAFR